MCMYGSSTNISHIVGSLALDLYTSIHGPFVKLLEHKHNEKKTQVHFLSYLSLWCWQCCCTRPAQTRTSTPRCLMGRRPQGCSHPHMAPAAQRSYFSSESSRWSLPAPCSSDGCRHTERTEICRDGCSVWLLVVQTGNDRHDFKNMFYCL